MWECPDDAVAAVVLAHGAGAGMRHASMQAIADAFERRGIATLRFDFPFMAAGRNRVDSPPVATQAIAGVYAAATQRAVSRLVNDELLKRSRAFVSQPVVDE